MAYKTFRVSGRGEFPIDMLRYDRAYPASEYGSQIISLSGRDNNRWEVIIATESPHSPTIPRWESFGCKVNE